jgi:hypothetical protein
MTVYPVARRPTNSRGVVGRILFHHNAFCKHGVLSLRQRAEESLQAISTTSRKVRADKEVQYVYNGVTRLSGWP